MNSTFKVIVACASLAAASAFAQEGLSIGGSIGQSHWKGDDLGGLATDRSDTAGKIYGGYSFTPNFSLEGGYVDLGKFHGDNGTLKGNGLYLDAVGTVPLGYNFSALGRLGLFNGKLRSEDTLGAVNSDTGTNLKLGLGVQYDLDKNLAIRTEWERYRFDALDTRGNTDLYSVGVNYRF